MKRLIIICEGLTEIEFCKDVLSPHFLQFNIDIHTPLIKKSGGGIVPWENLRKQIILHLTQDKAVFVTTFFDYYGIQEKHKFPNWQVANKEADKVLRLNKIEEAMQHDIPDNLKHRFLAYLQLHEFESLLFTDLSVFTENIPQDEILNIQELKRILENYPNPELINDTENGAPSKRLKRLIKGYHKIVHGSILASELGLSQIRSKNKKFDAWCNYLENL